MFSETELQLASDRDFILTKNAVIQKVYEHFGSLGSMTFDLMKPLQGQYARPLMQLPKLSKGENYMGFPWVMLDYPRFFDKKEGHLAIRTFFWWGHYFLPQLHVTHQFQKNVLNNLTLKPDYFSDFEVPVWLGYPEDPYNYQIPQAGMKLIDSERLKLKPRHHNIFKIMIPVPLHKGDYLGSILPRLASLFFKED